MNVHFVEIHYGQSYCVIISHTMDGLLKKEHANWICKEKGVVFVLAMQLFNPEGTSQEKWY